MKNREGEKEKENTTEKATERKKGESGCRNERGRPCAQPPQSTPKIQSSCGRGGPRNARSKHAARLSIPSLFQPSLFHRWSVGRTLVATVRCGAVRCGAARCVPRTATSENASYEDACWRVPRSARRNCYGQHTELKSPATSRKRANIRKRDG